MALKQIRCFPQFIVNIVNNFFIFIFSGMSFEKYNLRIYDLILNTLLLNIDRYLYLIVDKIIINLI